MPIKDSSSYESMFGAKEIKEIDYIMPATLPININEKGITEIMDKARKEKKWVLVFVIGTKPCFYKFYGSIVESNKAGIPNFVINSNQHYDEILTHGLSEFGFNDKIMANLSIRGDLAQKSAELFMKIGWIARYLKKKWPDVTAIPVVLGDTILTAIVPPAWMFSRKEKAIQQEAGLRSMAPEIMKKPKTSIENFIDKQFYGRWILSRNEPFPEQYDTFISAAGSEFMFCPVELNKKHLIREGHPKENIFTIGGVVTDALELKRKEKPKESIFNIYPRLEKGEWIRIDIHRRGNLTPRRFKAIIGAITELVKKGYNINFIEMSATKSALDYYNLRGEIIKLKKHKNFLFTNIWPEYTHVVEFFESKHCFAAFTDSGGVQEEMNLLNKMCMTCRLNTDRPETVKEGKGNILVPPIDRKFIGKMVEHISRNEPLQSQMRNPKQIYGKKVGRKFASNALKLMQRKEKPFKWVHDSLGLWKDRERNIDYL